MKKKNNNILVVIMSLLICLRFHLKLPLLKMLVLFFGDLGWKIIYNILRVKCIIYERICMTWRTWWLIYFLDILHPKRLYQIYFMFLYFLYSLCLCIYFPICNGYYILNIIECFYIKFLYGLLCFPYYFSLMTKGGRIDIKQLIIWLWGRNIYL